MKVVSLFGAKHGVGTSTTACLLHVVTPRSLLVSHDVEDTHALLGMMPVDPQVLGYMDISDDWYEPSDRKVIQFNPAWKINEARLRTARFASDADTIVMDWGVTYPTFGAAVMVCDNSYVALRRAVTIPQREDTWLNVVLMERARALTERDIQNTLGSESVFLDRDSSVQRGCDAGLLALRAPMHTTKPLTQLMEDLPECSFSSTP